MKISNNGLKLIKKFEGYSDKTYLDAAGLPTIGYGHLIKSGEVFSGKINHIEAEELLIIDINYAERSVNRLITANLNQSQYDSLVSFTYNLGGGALQRSTLRRKIIRREYISAADEFPKWVYAGGRKLRGLLRRRLAERELYLS